MISTYHMISIFTSDPRLLYYTMPLFATFSARYGNTLPFHSSLPLFPSTLPFHSSLPLFPSTLPFHSSLPLFPSTLPFHSSLPLFPSRSRLIRSLRQELDYGEAASTLCNVDMILKWLTLRFFDTNTSVFVKLLDYCKALLLCLERCDYSMSDLEANSFVPYLISKVVPPVVIKLRAPVELMALKCRDNYF